MGNGEIERKKNQELSPDLCNGDRKLLYKRWKKWDRHVKEMENYGIKDHVVMVHMHC